MAPAIPAAALAPRPTPVPPDLKFLHRLPRARPGYFESKSGNIRPPIMHRAVEANGFVFVGGTIADDTSVSMGEQTRNILGKIAGYLKEGGTNQSRVGSASIFGTDLSKKNEMDAAWTEFFGDNLPTRVTVG